MMAAMLAYPKELRARVVGAVEQGELTIAEISNLFGVGPTFIKRCSDYIARVRTWNRGTAEDRKLGCKSKNWSCSVKKSGNTRM